MNSAYQILTLPGLAGSSSQHWQSIWEDQHPENIRRVEQDNWDWPVRETWVDKFQEYVNHLQKPTILVGHSMGCITIAHWAMQHSSQWIKGALLVAPADVELSKRLSFVEGFAPIPTGVIPFKTIVVASSNDPYASLERSRKFASAWGSDFINLGEKGHINAISKLGDWKEGKSLLSKLTTPFSFTIENELMYSR